MAKVILERSAIQADSNLQALATQVAIYGGSINYTESNDSVVYGVSNKNVGVENAKYVVSKGGDVKEYPLWIEINSPEDNVTTGLIGATVTDEDDVTTNVTWGEWLKPNNYIIEREGQKYVATSAHTGVALDMSQLVPVFDSLVDSIPDAPGE